MKFNFNIKSLYSKFKHLLTVNNIFIALALAAVIFLIAWTEFSYPYIHGADPYTHTRMAYIIRDQGMPKELHWARYSTLRENYSDRDFFLHYAIIPFTYLSNNFYFTGKIAVVIFNAITLFVLVWVAGVFVRKRWIPWLILGLFFSTPYFGSIHLLRPHIFSLAFGLWGLRAIIKRNFFSIFLAAFFFSLFHITSVLMLVMAVFYEIIRKINGAKFSFKPIVVVFSGLFLALFFYPNFYSNFMNLYVQIYSQILYAVLGAVSQYGGIKFPIGGEMNPTNTRAFLFDFPFVIIGIALLILILTLRNIKISPKTQFLSWFALLFIVLSFFSYRYAVQAYPYIILFVFAFISELDEQFNVWKKFRKQKILWLAIIPVLIVVIYLGKNVVINVQRQIESEKVNTQHIESGEWMRDNLQPGELVYNSSWSDGTQLFGINPNNDYLDLLSSEYMYLYDPDLYKLRMATNDGQGNVYYNIKYIFKARYIYTHTGTGLVGAIQNDSRFKVLYSKNGAVVFEVL
ncbi:MAG: hypothetical protein WC323_00585 [Patescibacteria group bacterium]|jgi:hypothetical protein